MYNEQHQLRTEMLHVFLAHDPGPTKQGPKKKCWNFFTQSDPKHFWPNPMATDEIIGGMKVTETQSYRRQVDSVYRWVKKI